MNKNYTTAEAILHLPPGSTKMGEDMLKPVVVEQLKKKTDELKSNTEKIEYLKTLPKTDLIKHGFDLNVLEDDKVKIRLETFEVYDIAKSLLNSYKKMMDSLPTPNDKMWMAGAKLIDSVTNSLDKLLNMTLKFKQDEEMSGMVTLEEEEKSSKKMSTSDWFKFITDVKNTDDDQLNNILTDSTNTNTDK